VSYDCVDYSRAAAEEKDIEPENMSREETEKRLLAPGQKDGAFIIRKSQGRDGAIALAGGCKFCRLS
jgi:hypothetical protein